jgi:hypothetical protein
LNYCQLNVATREEELPYPAMTVGDLQENYSAGHVRFAIRQCRDVIARAIAEDNQSDQLVARVTTLRCLYLQLARAVQWVEDEADLMAGSCDSPNLIGAQPS